MERKPQAIKGSKGDAAKAARIKDALRANIARRKAQARGRAAGRQADEAEDEGQE